MALTVLFDLDDTLLQNDINLFLPAYLKALGGHMARFVAPDKMVPTLLNATQNMTLNELPGMSLEATFDQAFYPAIGQSKEGLRPALEDFYDRVFPTLQPLTAQKPESIDLVRRARALGHSLVVATNPLFPRKAIEHRMRWAGLPPEEAGFALFTSYESFHFAKPNPAFFAEVLAQLGWPDQPAVVIGNSLSDDILPAAALGLPAFWVTESAEALPPALHPLSSQGTIDQAGAWLERVNEARPKWEISTPAGLIAVLAATPAAFDTLARGLSTRQWEQRPEPTEWSVTEILCHLRDVDAEVNLPRIEKVLAGDNPFLPGINSDTWTDERKYCNQDGQLALSEFIMSRVEILNRLKSLTPVQWNLPARHAIFGPTRLFELVSFFVTHDQSHVQQIYQAARRLS